MIDMRKETLLQAMTDIINRGDKAKRDIQSAILTADVLEIVAVKKDLFNAIDNLNNLLQSAYGLRSIAKEK